VDIFPGEEQEIFLLFKASRPALGCILGSSTGANRPGREEGDHSFLSIAEVKNEWSYTSTPTHAFIALLLIRHEKTLPVLNG
jgi:hypothetical protein